MYARRPRPQGAELVIIRGIFEGKVKAQCIDIEQVGGWVCCPETSKPETGSPRVGD